MSIISPEIQHDTVPQQILTCSNEFRDRITHNGFNFDNFTIVTRRTIDDFCDKLGLELSSDERAWYDVFNKYAYNINLSIAPDDTTFSFAKKALAFALSSRYSQGTIDNPVFYTPDSELDVANFVLKGLRLDRTIDRERFLEAHKQFDSYGNFSVSNDLAIDNKGYETSNLILKLYLEILNSGQETSLHYLYSLDPDVFSTLGIYILSKNMTHIIHSNVGNVAQSHEIQILTAILQSYDPLPLTYLENVDPYDDYRLPSLDNTEYLANYLRSREYLNRIYTLASDYMLHGIWHNSFMLAHDAIQSTIGSNRNPQDRLQYRKMWELTMSLDETYSNEYSFFECTQKSAISIINKALAKNGGALYQQMCELAKRHEIQINTDLTEHRVSYASALHRIVILEQLLQIQSDDVNTFARELQDLITKTKDIIRMRAFMPAAEIERKIEQLDDNDNYSLLIWHKEPDIAPIKIQLSREDLGERTISQMLLQPHATRDPQGIDFAFTSLARRKTVPVIVEGQIYNIPCEEQLIPLEYIGSTLLAQNAYKTAKYK